MRIITFILALVSILGLASLVSPVGAKVAVSGEARINTSSPIDATLALRVKIIEQIKKTKKEIATLTTQITYVQEKMQGKTGATLKVFTKKLEEITSAKKKAETTLAYLTKKLANLTK